MRTSPLFLAVPALYAFTLLLLPLPWIEIEIGQIFSDRIGAEPQRSVQRSVELTGWQLAFAKYAITFAEKEGSPVAVRGSWESVLGPPLLLAGLALSLFLPSGKVRVAAITTCSIFAFIFIHLFNVSQATSYYVETRYTPWGTAAALAMLATVLLAVFEWWKQARSRPAAFEPPLQES